MTSFTILKLLFKARCEHWRKHDSEAAMAYRSLLKPHSYRLQSGDHGNPLIGLRYIRLAHRLLFKQGLKIKTIQNNTVLCFDGSEKAIESRQKYLKGLNIPQPGHWLGRDALGGRGFGFNQARSFLLTFLLFLLYLPHLIFFKNKASYALMLLEFAEWCVLMKAIHVQGIEKMYFFCSFEIDGNFISLLAKRHEIRTIRIPSSTPLSNFYKEVSGDTFAFTAPFQIEEYELFKKQWHVNKTINLPCFNYPELLKLKQAQKDPLKSEKSLSLGILTRGIWRRIERGDSPNDLGEYRSEEELLEAVRLTIAQFPAMKVTILMHPCEKDTEDRYKQAQTHYRKLLQSENLIFPEREEKSLSLFYDMNIAISTHSSSNIERLFLGLKTFYFPSQISAPLYKQTQLKNISLRSPDELVENLETAFSQTNKEFFEEKGMESYVNFGL